MLSTNWRGTDFERELATCHLICKSDRTDVQEIAHEIALHL